MVNDKVIQAFQKIIKKSFPETNGLQDPILGENLAFSTYRDTPFLQVLHDGKAHWIAISTYECNQGEVYLLDSLFKGRISDHIKKQICTILNCPLEKITIKVLPVQQQTNGVDCGILCPYCKK